MNNIQKQLDYYKQNKDTIIQQYAGKVITISEQLDIKEYSTELEAYNASVDLYGYGNFLLKNLVNETSQQVHIISPIITSVSNV